MKFTPDQAAILQELVDSPEGRIIVQVNGTQLARTINSLKRKSYLSAKFIKVPPGRRYSYGYRGFEITRAWLTPAAGTRVPGVIVDFPANEHPARYYP